MPLVVLSGQPASGKSTVAAALRALFDESSTHVNIVDEPSLHLTRAAAYATGAAEKNTRASLKSTVERLASKQAVTILDSINNIKVRFSPPILYRLCSLIALIARPAYSLHAARVGHWHSALRRFPLPHASPVGLPCLIEPAPVLRLTALAAVASRRCVPGVSRAQADNAAIA